MTRFNIRSLLVLAFLALPVTALAGQSAAEVRERRERERAAQRQFEEQLQRVQEAHEETALRALEHQHALQEVQEETILRALEHQHALQEVQEQKERIRTRVLQDQERALFRVRENLRDRMGSLQQVMVQVRSRARLGVSLDARQGREFDRQGALVKSVMDDSPAQAAGIHVGDIITHLDGHSLLDPIPNEEDEDFDDYESLPVQRLMALAQALEGDEPVEVRYLRGETEASVSLTPTESQANWVTSIPEGRRGGMFFYGPEGRGTIRLHMEDMDELREELLPRLEELKESFKDLTIHLDDFEMEELDLGGRGAWTFRSSPNIHFFSPEGQFTPGEERGNFRVFRGGDDMGWSVITRGGGYGLELRELNPDLGSYFSAESGVLVMSVDDDSTLPLQAGDVILRVGDRIVEDTSDFFRIMRSYEEGERVTITVMRHGQETRVEGEAR